MKYKHVVITRHDLDPCPEALPDKKATLNYFMRRGARNTAALNGIARICPSCLTSKASFLSPFNGLAYYFNNKSTTQSKYFIS